MTHVDDTVPAEAMRLRLKRLEALEKLSDRARRGEFDEAIRAYEARKGAPRRSA